MQYKITETVWRENQYEIIYEVFDDDGKLVSGGMRSPIGAKELDAKAIEDLFTAKIFPEIEASKVEVLVEQVYTKAEIESLLISKGLIAETEKLEDLKTLAELKEDTVVEEIKV